MIDDLNKKYIDQINRSIEFHLKRSEYISEFEGGKDREWVEEMKEVISSLRLGVYPTNKSNIDMLPFSKEEWELGKENELNKAILSLRAAERYTLGVSSTYAPAFTIIISNNGEKYSWYFCESNWWYMDYFIYGQSTDSISFVDQYGTLLKEKKFNITYSEPVQ
jgi:hypothetical protein